MALTPLRRSRYELMDPVDPESLQTASPIGSPNKGHEDENVDRRRVMAYRRPTIYVIMVSIIMFLCVLYFSLHVVLLNGAPQQARVAELQKRLDQAENRETKILTLLTELQREVAYAQGVRGVKAPSSANVAQAAMHKTGGNVPDGHSVQSGALIQPTVAPSQGIARNSVNDIQRDVYLPRTSQTVAPDDSQPLLAARPSPAAQPLSHVKEPSIAQPPSGVQQRSNYSAIRAAATESVEDLTNVDWPEGWRKTYSADTLAASAKEALPWKIKTLNAMKHAWAGYSRPNVYGADVLRPISGLPGNRWAKAAFTMVDALSTLWLMGMFDEFARAATWIEKNLHFDYTGYVSVFEIIIRELGGLLAAYALSHNEIFKRKARELGEKLMPAFRETLPSAQISLGTGMARGGGSKGVLLAEVGTLQLEFRYLSEITGDPKFKAKGDAAIDFVLHYGGSKGLVPVNWGGPFASRPGPTSRFITFGATGDSYYEYLLKLWLQGGKKEDKFLNAWTLSMEQMKERLIRNTPTYSVVLEEAFAGRIIPKMDHLACFVGGMLALGDHEIVGRTGEYFKLAERITTGCFEMYNSTKTGLAPEIFAFRSRPKERPKLSVKPDATRYLLRPETAESIFYLFYYTGNPKYRRWAGHIIDALEKETKCRYGYCSITDVTVSPATKNDEMESFFLAETLKYLYLTFVTSPKQILDLDKFVFNTEAHPLPRLTNA